MTKDEILHQSKILLCKIYLKRRKTLDRCQILRDKAESFLTKNETFYDPVEICKKFLSKDEQDEIQELNSSLKHLRTEQGRIGSQLASYLSIYSEMITYEVDLWGRASCFGSVVVPDTENGPNLYKVEEKIKESQEKEGYFGHKERSEVESFLHNEGFESTSAGGGTGGWDLGYSLTKADADRLCVLIWKEYQVEIETGLIDFRRNGKEDPYIDKFDYDAMDAFIKEYNVSIKEV